MGYACIVAQVCVVLGAVSAELAEEVREKGWIVYSARSENGTWDLFLARPDGSQKRNITETGGAVQIAGGNNQQPALST